MMNKFFRILTMIVCVALIGCAKQERVAIRIGDIAITVQEFESALSASRFADLSTAGRKEFLDNYISKKLILREAERMGLDKKPEFLQDIQMYWEQGLLKLVLAKKSQELSQTAQISEAAVKDYYEKHKESSFADKELSQVYKQIEWLLLREEQNKMMGSWVDSLKGATNIKIDYNLLGINR